MEMGVCPEERDMCCWARSGDFEESEPNPAKKLERIRKRDHLEADYGLLGSSL
jgi:hypothetical protein